MGPKSAGVFLVVDGPDGCGKSTQARRLVSALRRQGRSVLHLREPGGTELSERIRSLLLDRAGAEPVLPAEVLLYLAARAQLVREKILPALARGFWVVCERFSSSTCAYQGRAAGADPRRIRQLDRYATGGLRPDLTVILDIAPEIGMRRLARDRAKDRVESRPLEYHRRVRQGFLEWAEAERRRARVIDAGLSRDEVTERIAREVERAVR